MDSARPESAVRTDPTDPVTSAEVGSSTGRTPGADWRSDVVDPSERRKIQNKLAQRRFRQKAKEQKEKAEFLKRRVGTNAEIPELSGLPWESISMSSRESKKYDNSKQKEKGKAPAIGEEGVEERPVVKPSEDVDVDWSEVGWDENIDGPITIQCVCGYADDKRHIVQCEKCEKWQHIACYYETAQNIVEVHECVDCSPRALGKRITGRTLSERDGGDGSTYGTASMPSRIRAEGKSVGRSSIDAGSRSVAKSTGNYTAATSEVGRVTVEKIPEKERSLALMGAGKSIVIGSAAVAAGKDTAVTSTADLRTLEKMKEKIGPLRAQQGVLSNDFIVNPFSHTHVCDAFGCSQSFASLDELHSHQVHAVHEPILSLWERDNMIPNPLSDSSPLANEGGISKTVLVPHSGKATESSANDQAHGIHSALKAVAAGISPQEVGNMEAPLQVVEEYVPAIDSWQAFRHVDSDVLSASSSTVKLTASEASPSLAESSIVSRTETETVSGLSTPTAGAGNLSTSPWPPYRSGSSTDGGRVVEPLKEPSDPWSAETFSSQDGEVEHEIVSEKVGGSAQDGATHTTYANQLRISPSPCSSSRAPTPSFGLGGGEVSPSYIRSGEEWQARDRQEAISQRPSGRMRTSNDWQPKGTERRIPHVNSDYVPAKPKPADLAAAAIVVGDGAEHHQLPQSGKERALSRSLSPERLFSPGDQPRSPIIVNTRSRSHVQFRSTSSASSRSNSPELYTQRNTQFVWSCAASEYSHSTATTAPSIGSVNLRKDASVARTSSRGEIRLRVDGSAPLSLQSNGDMEGRTPQINPAKGSKAKIEIVLGNKRYNKRPLARDSEKSMNITKSHKPLQQTKSVTSKEPARSRSITGQPPVGLSQSNPLAQPATRPSHSSQESNPFAEPPTRNANSTRFQRQDPLPFIARSSLLQSSAKTKRDQRDTRVVVEPLRRKATPSEEPYPLFERRRQRPKAVKPSLAIPYPSFDKHSPMSQQPESVPPKEIVSLDTGHYNQDLSYDQRSPLSHPAVSPVLQKSWSERLKEYCKAQNLRVPTWRAISESRGIRTAWSAVVELDGQSYPARLWYDNMYLEQAMEDAARVAWESLSQKTEEGGNKFRSEAERTLSLPVDTRAFGETTDRTENWSLRQGLPSSQNIYPKPSQSIFDEQAPKRSHSTSAQSGTRGSTPDISPTRHWLLPPASTPYFTPSARYHVPSQSARTERFPPSMFDSSDSAGDSDPALESRARMPPQKLKRQPTFTRSKSATLPERTNERKPLMATSATISKTPAHQAAIGQKPEITVELSDATTGENNDTEVNDHALQVEGRRKDGQEVVKKSSWEVEILVQLAVHSLSSTPDLTEEVKMENSPYWIRSCIGRKIGTLTKRYTVWEVDGVARKAVTELSHMVQKVVTASRIAKRYPNDSLDFDTFIIGRTSKNSQLALIFSSQNRHARKNAVEAVKQSSILETFPGIVILHMAHHPIHYFDLADPTERSRTPPSNRSELSFSRMSKDYDLENDPPTQNKTTLLSAAQYEPIPSLSLEERSLRLQLSDSEVGQDDGLVIQSTNAPRAAADGAKPASESAVIFGEPSANKTVLESENAGVSTESFPRISAGALWSKRYSALLHTSSTSSTHRSSYQSSQRSSITSAHTVSSTFSGPRSRHPSMYDIVDSEPPLEKPVPQPFGVFQPSNTYAQQTVERQPTPEISPSQPSPSRTHAPQSDLTESLATLVDEGHIESDWPIEPREYHLPRLRDVLDNVTLQSNSDDDDIATAKESALALSKVNRTYTKSPNEHTPAMREYTRSGSNESSSLNKGEDKERSSDKLRMKLISTTTLEGTMEAQSAHKLHDHASSYSPQITTGSPEVEKERIRNATKEYEVDRWRIIAAKMGSGFSPAECRDKATELEAERTKDEEDLSDVSHGPSSPDVQNEKGWLECRAIATAGALSPIDGRGLADELMTVEVEKARDSIENTHGLGLARSPQDHLEQGKAWSSRSYRSASVGTDIGNETDDTEFTTGGDDPQIKRKAPGARRFARQGVNIQLGVLEEESSDDGFLDEEREEHAQSQEKEKEKERQEREARERVEGPTSGLGYSSQATLKDGGDVHHERTNMIDSPSSAMLSPKRSLVTGNPVSTALGASTGDNYTTSTPGLYRYLDTIPSIYLARKTFQKWKAKSTNKLESDLQKLEKSSGEAQLDHVRMRGLLLALQKDIEDFRSETTTRPEVGAVQIEDSSPLGGQPLTPMEWTIQALFAESLGIKATLIGRQDNFFTLIERYKGFDYSLPEAVVQLSRTAWQHDVDISPDRIARHPMLSDLACWAIRLSSDTDNARPNIGSDAIIAETDDPDECGASSASSMLVDDEPFEAHLFTGHGSMDEVDWKGVRAKLPEDWMWDVDYTTTHNTGGKDHGCWTCTPTEPDNPKNIPLTISGTPVVLPVEYQWPPMAGVNPPPDPRPSTLVDCTAELSLEVIRDLFLTFEGSIGFYVLINGLLQIIVSEDFDTEWASSHLPHKYGGLKVCYIHQTMEPTMFQVPSKTETMKSKASQASQSSSISSIFRSSSSRPANSLVQPLQINDFIEARAKSLSKKEKFAGRIGLKVQRCGEPYLVMSTHVITEAILAKSHMGGIFSRRDRFEKLDDDWNEHVEIWAGNEKIGTIERSFDEEAEVYPNGFKHDITLIKPTNSSTIKDITSPLSNLGWLSRSTWHSLRQRSAPLKILGPTESHRASKTLKTSRPSEVLVVGEGIFRNQASSKPTRDHDIATWKSLVSRAVLYRVYPDFDPPTGYSGVALYAEGTREDDTEGPGVVGFQSFVQRSGHVQSFEMEGGALENRLKLGRVAFYGAFMVPEELKREYGIA